SCWRGGPPVRWSPCGGSAGSRPWRGTDAGLDDAGWRSPGRSIGPMVSKAGEREAFLLGGPLPARSRAFISVWSLVWLAAVLVAPIVGLAGRHAGRDRLLGAALAAAGFAAVYLAGTWAVMTERAPSARWPWGWPAVLALYAVGLVATFGGEF